MILTIKIFLRFLLYPGIWLIYIPVVAYAIYQPDTFLSKYDQVVERIKKDEINLSFTLMVNDKIMKEHTLSSHNKGQHFFYTDKRHNISEIVSMVLERPDGLINETATTGLLKIYRTFNFKKDIRILYAKEKRPLNSFYNAYLGETPEGPTNQVMIIIKVSKHKQDEKELYSIASSYSALQFIDAYPVKLN